jgi:hypothetical protein
MTARQTPARDGVPVPVTGGPSPAVTHPYRYFISYAHGRTALAFGELDLPLAQPITSAEDLALIRAHLKARGTENVSIVSWQLFPTAPTPASPAGGTR